MEDLADRIRTLRRKLVFLWFAIGPATITIYIVVCKLVEPKLAARGVISPAVLGSLDWILAGSCVVGTVVALWAGRILMSDGAMRRAAARGPTAEMPDPLAARVLSTQVLMGALAEMIVLVGMLMFYLGASFNEFLSYAVFGLGLTIYLGGTIPARLNRFEEVALSVQEGVDEAGEPSEDD